jgi:hypothetical protein
MERSKALERFYSALRAPFTDLPWVPLPGTQKEAEAIQRLFPHAVSLLGREATKQALLKVEAPRVLHIATHGFFLEDASVEANTRGVAAVGQPAPLRNSPDPLLRSGLVLAGARTALEQPGVGGYENSLVTALELAGLNL